MKKHLPAWYSVVVILGTLGWFFRAALDWDVIIRGAVAGAVLLAMLYVGLGVRWLWRRTFGYTKVTAIPPSSSRFITPGSPRLPLRRRS